MNPSQKNKLERNAKIKICGSVQQRYVTAVLCALAATLELFQRSCISVTMDLMVRPINITLTEQRSQCPKGPGHTIHDHSIGEFDWSSEMQKYILLSFYVGYIVTQLPMGWLADRYGFKWPFIATMVTSSVITAATPIVTAVFDKWGLIFMNVLLGIAQGGLYPVLAATIARWYPLSERCRFGGILIGGNTLGAISAQVLLYCAFRHYHWSFMFYFGAGLGGVMSIVLAGGCYSVPDETPCITKREKSYLKANLYHLSPLKELAPVPWKLMLTSLPVWAYIAIHVGHDWVLYGMLLDMPSYMSDVLRFDHVEVIIWSVVPVVLLWITTLAWGFFSDYLLERGLMNLNDLRKMNTLISSFGPGLFLLFSSYARCDVVLVVLFFTLCMAATGIFFSGAKLNAIDLCPNYSGTLMGISNGLGSLGALAPNIINVVTTKGTLAEWRNAFWLDFSVISTAAVIFILFGSSEVQSWNMPRLSELPSESSVDRPTS